MPEVAAIEMMLDEPEQIGDMAVTEALTDWAGLTTTTGLLVIFTILHPAIEAVIFMVSFSGIEGAKRLLVVMLKLPLAVALPDPRLLPFWSLST